VKTSRAELLRRLAQGVLEAPDLAGLARLLTASLPEAAGVAKATLLFWDRKLETFQVLNPGETQAAPAKPQENAPAEPRARWLITDGQLIETAASGGTTLVPLLARSGLVGMLELESLPGRPRALRPAEVRQLSDIARRSALAIENLLYQRELIATERMAALGTMAGMLAHDFRGPMTVIRGYAETLLEGGLKDAEVKERATLITNMVDRLERMTAETMDFARGSGPLVRRTLAVPVLLAELAEGIALELPGLIVTRAFEAPESLVIALDLDKLRRVVSNLAANAREAMGGRGTLRFSARLEGERLAIEIADSGPGVPAAIRERIFEPFVTHGKKRGTGLGLAVARRFVEEHGGTIELLPEGPGARFKIALPLGTAGPAAPSKQERGGV
jgi:signal transduction histidine kinase